MTAAGKVFDIMKNQELATLDVMIMSYIIEILVLYNTLILLSILVQLFVQLFSNSYYVWQICFTSICFC